MAEIDSVLRWSVKERASDLHLATGSSFVVRRFGKLKKVKTEPLAADKAKDLIYEILSPAQRKNLEQKPSN